MSLPVLLLRPAPQAALVSGRRPISEAVEFYAAAVAVFLAPINYLRLNLAYVTLSDAVMVFVLVMMALNGRLPLRPFGKATSLWYGSLGLLGGGLMVSSIVNGDAGAGAIVVGQYVFAFALVPMVILGQPPKKSALLVKVFVASMVFISVHGAYYVNFHDGPSEFVKGNGRMSSLVERVNETAALHAFTIVFVFWLFLTGRGSWLFAVVSLPVLGYGLLLTGSNTGLIVTTFGILSLSVLSGSVRILLMLVGFGVVVLGAIVVWGDQFLPQVFVDRVLVALQSADLEQAGTFAGRLRLMQEAVGVANDTMILGLGADQYRLVSVLSAPVHNVYLLALTEGGLPALVGLVGIILSIVYLGWSALLDPASRWGGKLTLTVVAMFAICLTGIPHVYARFWVVPLMLAVSTGLTRTVSSRETVFPRPSRLSHREGPPRILVRNS